MTNSPLSPRPGSTEEPTEPITEKMIGVYRRVFGDASLINQLCDSHELLRAWCDAQRAEIAELRTSALRYGYAHARCEGAAHGGIIAPMEDACDECKDEAARRFPAVSQERQDATHNKSTEK